MKHTYFTDYISDIQNIYGEYLEKYNDAFVTVERARAAKKAADENFTDQFRAQKRMITEKEMRDAERDFARNATRLQSEAGNAITSLREDLQSDIAEYTAADPGKLDANAVTLLNSGIMGYNDLVRMANSQWGNVTMLRLIGNHAKKLYDADPTSKDGRNANVLYSKIQHYCSGKDQLDVFDAAGGWVNKCLQSNERVAAAMQKEAPAAFENLHELMANTDSFRAEV